MIKLCKNIAIARVSCEVFDIAHSRLSSHELAQFLTRSRKTIEASLATVTTRVNKP